MIQRLELQSAALKKRKPASRTVQPRDNAHGKDEDNIVCEQAASTYNLKDTDASGDGSDGSEITFVSAMSIASELCAETDPLAVGHFPRLSTTIPQPTRPSWQRREMPNPTYLLYNEDVARQIEDLAAEVESAFRNRRFGIKSNVPLEILACVMPEKVA